jgi:TRAP-type mannitol/chloroaromatic compound transport system permease large subunit
VSRGVRFLISLAIIAVGVVLLSVSTLIGAVVIGVGVIAMPWFPGMGAGG